MYFDPMGQNAFEPMGQNTFAPMGQNTFYCKCDPIILNNSLLMYMYNLAFQC